MSGMKPLLVTGVVLLAANLLVALVRPSGPTVSLATIASAQAQGISANSVRASVVYTVGDNGRTIYVWEDDGRGWKAKEYKY